MKKKLYKMIQKNSKQTVATLFALLFATVSITGALYFGGESNEAEAGKVWLKPLTVISPKPPQVREYKAGDVVDFRVKFSWIYCSNKGPGRVVGQITQIRPTDRDLGGFGGKSPGVLGGNWVRDKHVTFNSQWATRIRMPDRPGRYHFRYRVGVESPEGDKFHIGKVVFKVKDDEQRDLCRNMNGNQSRVPSGHIQVRNANGQPICIREGDLGLSCSVSDASIEPGGTVTFNAATDVDATFKWFDGADVTGTPVKTSSGRSSSLSRTYNDRGIYLVSVLAQSGTQVQQCTRGVTVRGANDDDLTADDLGDLLDDLGDLDNLFIDDDGNIFFLDPSAGPATIDFGFNGNGLTNTTCEAVWNAQNVLKCDLYRNDELLKEIDASGTDDVEPGSYYIKCLALSDGSEIQSELQTCRLNPGSSEI